VGFSFSLELLTQGRPSVLYLDTRPPPSDLDEYRNGKPSGVPHSPLTLVLTFEIAEPRATGILERPSCLGFGGRNGQSLQQSGAAKL
jgi:hypothetical protein